MPSRYTATPSQQPPYRVHLLPFDARLGQPFMGGPLDALRLITQHLEGAPIYSTTTRQTAFPSSDFSGGLNGGLAGGFPISNRA